MVVVVMINLQMATYKTSGFVIKNLKDSKEDFYIEGLVLETFKRQLQKEEVKDFYCNDIEVKVNKDNNNYILTFNNLKLLVLTNQQEIIDIIF